MKKFNWLSVAVAAIVLVLAGYFLFSQPATVDEITPEVEEVQSEVHVLFSINDASYSVTMSLGSSALSLMNQVMEDNEDFSFSGSDSEFGFFVEEINGIANDNDKSMYWSLYSNNELAQFGVSDYIIEDGDVLDWRYEEVKF